MTEFDRQMLKAFRIKREEIPCAVAQQPLRPDEAEIHGYTAPDGSTWVPYAEVEALINFNQTLYQQARDYQAAAVRWCGEARDASRTLRGARATAFMLAGLIFAMGAAHALFS